MATSERAGSRVTKGGGMDAEVGWIKRADGRYCERHLSWTCGAMQGECQREFIGCFAALWGVSLDFGCVDCGGPITTVVHVDNKPNGFCRSCASYWIHHSVPA